MTKHKHFTRNCPDCMAAIQACGKVKKPVQCNWKECESAPHPIIDRYMVDDDLFEKVQRHMYGLLMSNFGTDVDHDSQVEMTLVRRDKYERMHFAPVPYGPDFEERFDWEKTYDYLNRHTFNLSVAWENFSRAMRLIQDAVREHRDAEKKKKEKKP